MDKEQQRLHECKEGGVPWKKWGPYLSERQWGTVREDYSKSGDAWNYFSHDQARSRAYRWGEDGLAGISDDQQNLCFALALWNGQDPILKERLFGLTNSEGNHGEDVKEYYFYLDSTPTHSYMKYLYKYPQCAFPYADLVAKNIRRSRLEPEYELLDTGAFAQSRYFDVFVEYAKSAPEDILISITAYNRGDKAADLHLIPTLWFRNTWAMQKPAQQPGCRMHLLPAASDFGTIKCETSALETMYLYYQGQKTVLFTDNETNSEKLFGTANPTPYVKDAMHRYLIERMEQAVNPDRIGTKAAVLCTSSVKPGEALRMCLRLTRRSPTDFTQVSEQSGPFGDDFGNILEQRIKETDDFYQEISPQAFDQEQKRIMRQALAGLFWNKQFYYYDVDAWLEQRGENTFKGQTQSAPRNQNWSHLYNADVISMPDKWEYPWYASWDLAFHSLAFSLADMDFAKEQLRLVLTERYLHPSGLIPAYEWNFNDVNPPVLAWSALFTYQLEQATRGKGDRVWLQNIFQKLLLNFTWWVNRKDQYGKNVFEGGFLGLDNIGVFDRGAPLPEGGHLEQADGTAWMALYCQNMFQMAMELSKEEPVYGEMCLKFAQHFLLIACSMIKIGNEVSMWDEEDGFFYDILRMPHGSVQRLKIRSIVGLLPMCATTAFPQGSMKSFPEFQARFHNFLQHRPELTEHIHDIRQQGVEGRYLFSILPASRLKRILRYVLDENEFLSPYGIRSLSRYHADHPYTFRMGGGHEARISYTPAESDSTMFGGNSNWRGPLWFPINALVIRSLLVSFSYYGKDFRVECPTGSGRMLNLYEVAAELTRRLTSIFLPDKTGRRPVNGNSEVFKDDPHWRDLILFYEYFHGDTGAGLGASHQSGWSSVISTLMHLMAKSTPDDILQGGFAQVYSTVDARPRF